MTEILVTAENGTQAIIQPQSSVEIVVSGLLKGDPGIDGAGVPVGGVTGQVLAKNSASNYDTQWVTISGTGDMTKAVYDPANVGQQLVGLTAVQSLTHKDLTDATNTFPTLNQNTTGSAAKWTTARLLAGNSVDGSAAVAFANKFIAQGTADSGLSGAQFLGALGTGIVKNTTTTGVLSIATGADLPAMTATVGGAVPTPPNNTTNFLRGDGTWAIPAGGGTGDMVLASAQTNTGAKTFNASTLLDKGNQIFNVKAYGAVGNNTADDTTAIGLAITAAHAVGGGIVFFPPGTYKITAALVLTSGVSLMGVSPLGSIINQTGTTVNGMTLSNIAENYTQISNLTIQGPSSGSGIGIDLVRTTAGDNQAGVHLQDLIVKNFGSHGIWCTGAIISTFERVSSQSNGGDGFHIEQTGSNAGSTSVVFTACYALTNTGKGYYLGQNGTSSYMSMVSCAADSNAIGYYFTGITNVALHSCGAEGNGISYEVTGASTHVSFLACYSAACTNIDFWITGSSLRVVLENTYASSAGVGHTNGVRVDAGSHALLINHDNSSSVAAAGGNTFTGTVIEMDETIGTTAGYVATVDGAQTLTNKTFDTAGAGNVLKINGTTVSAVQGTGAVVLASSPTITTPTISGHFIAEGVTTTGAQGTGALVFASSPTLTTPNIGAATGTSLVLTVASSTAMVVGPSGTTSPTLKVDSSTASAVTGVSIVALTAGGASGVKVAAISSGTNENISLDAKGSGIVRLGVNSTGGVAWGTSANGALTNSGGVTADNVTVSAGTTAVAPINLTSGTNLTSAVAGAIEYDGIAFYATADTTSGRAQSPVRQHFRLTTNGSNVTTIGNFFGTTSNISLIASAYYEIEVVCWFTKTTSEALTWTFTNSAAPTSMNIHVEQSPLTGVVTTAATYLSADIVNSTTAAQTYVTGALTTAVNHFVKFRILLKNGTGTSLKIQATNPAGSITPLLGSYWTCVRIPTGNTGTFAA